MQLPDGPRHSWHQYTDPWFMQPSVPVSLEEFGLDLDAALAPHWDELESFNDIAMPRRLPQRQIFDAWEPEPLDTPELRIVDAYADRHREKPEPPNTVMLENSYVCPVCLETCRARTKAVPYEGAMVHPNCFPQPGRSRRVHTPFDASGHVRGSGLSG